MSPRSRDSGLLPARLDPRRRAEAAAGDPGQEIDLYLESAAIGRFEADVDQRWLVELAGKVHGADERAVLALASSTHNLALLAGVIFQAAAQDEELMAEVSRLLAKAE